MKNYKSIIVALVAVLAVAMPASAQLRFGIKAGMNVDKVSISEKDLGSNFSSDNRTGWQAGLMTEFTVPIIGIGFDASLMYVHHDKELSLTDSSLDYIEIPINLKYKLGLPAIGSIVTPYLATGPSFAIKCSKEDIESSFKAEDRKFDVAWNAAVGVELLKHLQVGVGYSWGINKLYKFSGSGDTQDVGRLNGWVISAAYMF